MTNEMITKYDEANIAALNAYKANTLSQVDKVHNTPKDIPGRNNFHTELVE